MPVLIYLLNTAQKMKFSIKDFFSKYDQILQKTADLVTFTEEILNGKHFLCSVLTAQNKCFTVRGIPKRGIK